MLLGSLCCEFDICKQILEKNIVFAENIFTKQVSETLLWVEWLGS